MNVETTRTRINKAIFDLRKSVIIAAQRKWITSEQSEILGTHIADFDKAVIAALPAPAPRTASAACLPF